ncbi:hypothetical protein [uncultured Bacteroides sp.]|uniref:hypothetical protein n=1 Tax=uncultured Bacteroides sp. TaxID=162156 RepID=UPI00259B34F6|nr:hypothetical protein [uncultured Bacteroides sp.]
MLRFILFFFLGPVPVSCLRCCRFSLWEREFQAVDTPVSLRGNYCSLAWKLLFPYVDTVVSLRVYSCFLAWKLPVSVAEAEATPGACYGNSV